MKNLNFIETYTDIKTELLSDAQLDWAVAAAMGFRTSYDMSKTDVWFGIIEVINTFSGNVESKCISVYSNDSIKQEFSPSKGNSYCIKLINECKITVVYFDDDDMWLASCKEMWECRATGNTFTEAAMRVFVMVKLGDTISVPTNTFKGVTFEQN